MARVWARACGSRVCGSMVWLEGVLRGCSSTVGSSAWLEGVLEEARIIDFPRVVERFSRGPQEARVIDFYKLIERKKPAGAKHLFFESKSLKHSHVSRSAWLQEAESFFVIGFRTMSP